jgi:uncharacterized membrane protein YebE (DUF533 family)
MASAATIVAELLSGVLHPAARERMERALASKGLSDPTNPLSGILRNLRGRVGDSGGAGQQQGGAFSGRDGLAQAVIGEMAADTNRGGGGHTDVLADLLLNGPLDSRRGGVLAAVGGIAAAARAQAGEAEPATSTADLPGAMRAAVEDPDDDPALGERADLLLEAIVLAARADGRLDAAEVRRIEDRMSEDGVGEAERSRFGELARGAGDLDGVVARIQDPQTAAEVYVASLLAGRGDEGGDEHHSATLAERTGLAPGTVEQLHRLVGLG